MWLHRASAAPRSRCQFPEMLVPGERGAAGALAAGTATRPPGHPRGKGGKEKWGEGEIIAPKLEFCFLVSFFTCRYELHCEPRPGSNLIEIGVGRGRFQKFMFILGDFSGFIYRSGSQPVL